MFPIVVAASLAETVRITSPTIRKIVLGNEDRLFIDGTARLIYIRASPHFISGNLTLTLSRPRQRDESVPLRPGDRYSFYYSNLTITYSDAWSPCEISLWLLTYQWCSLGIHTRNQRSAEIHLDGANRPSFWCYFFEFQSKPTASIKISDGTALLGLDNGNQTLTGNMSFDVPASMFVLSYQPQGGRLDAVFDAGSEVGDWFDKPGFFQYCLKMQNCTNFSGYADEFALTTDRAVPAWVVAVGIVLLAALIAMVGVGMFWGPEMPEFVEAGIASVRESLVGSAVPSYT
jgi:hypothetical protein